MKDRQEDKKDEKSKKNHITFTGGADDNGVSGHGLC